MCIPLALAAAGAFSWPDTFVSGLFGGLEPGKYPLPMKSDTKVSGQPSIGTFPTPVRVSSTDETDQGGSMKRLIAVVILVFLASGCSVSNPGETVISYLRAHNAQEIDMALANIADTIHYEVVGEWTMEGIDAMRQMEQWDAAIHSELDGSNYQVSGDTVWFDLVETTDWLTASGIGPLEYKQVRAIAKQGKISDFRITRDPAIGKQVRDTFTSILEWAEENGHQETLGSLMHQGEFTWNAEAAPAFVELTKVWRASN